MAGGKGGGRGREAEGRGREAEGRGEWWGERLAHVLNSNISQFYEYSRIYFCRKRSGKGRERRNSFPGFPGFPGLVCKLQKYDLCNHS